MIKMTKTLVLMNKTGEDLLLLKHVKIDKSLTYQRVMVDEGLTFVDYKPFPINQTLKAFAKRGWKVIGEL